MGQEFQGEGVAMGVIDIVCDVGCWCKLESWELKLSIQVPASLLEAESEKAPFSEKGKVIFLSF